MRGTNVILNEAQIEIVNAVMNNHADFIGSYPADDLGPLPTSKDLMSEVNELAIQRNLDCGQTEAVAKVVLANVWHSIDFGRATD